MFKYIHLLLVLCALGASASPSAVGGDSVADGCGGAGLCARSTTSAPTPSTTSEELSRAIERAVAAAIAQTVMDVPTTTTPAPTLLGSREEFASQVSALVKQAVKDLAPQTCTKEEIESIVAPCQRTVQSLTSLLEHVTASTSPKTQAPAPTCAVELASAAACRDTLRNLTEVVARLTPPAPPAPPAPPCDCDKRVAPCQLSVQSLTQSLAEMTRRVEQLAAPTTKPQPPLCISGYEFSPVSQHYYKLHIELVRWPVAEAWCRAEGAYLAIVNSREEARVLSNLRKKTPDVGCYIGVYKDSAGRWTTTTGEDVVAAAGHWVWRPNEDWNQGLWRYGEMWEDDTIGGRAELDSRYFICERAA